MYPISSKQYGIGNQCVKAHTKRDISRMQHHGCTQQPTITENLFIARAIDSYVSPQECLHRSIILLGKAKRRLYLLYNTKSRKNNQRNSDIWDSRVLVEYNVRKRSNQLYACGLKA